ncbi:MAG: adenylate/guanylate cyclase domain-containing protein [Rhodospirillales bacterium]|jgi:class 3 adenylate cyclase|nr:adenylate/guanylate cyclase domain-containing protein [Rhodospirillales bacterium]MDP6642537.1 adenylate/guanylate cyclase domain-containing protein [Rhodospirillales bacterium]MDP6841860.1 adenylate/guanylate cyclase domain-containing protein [Rhodospirillales bacterium]|tara:strand:- start:601 stop:2085 length:1485 start_codon:yes stop_codon:yes gene_type:complete
MRMQARYLVRMLGIAVFHILAFVTFMTIAGQFDSLIIALPLNLAVLVIINLTGAWVIFRPIRRYLEGNADLASAEKRIQGLAIYSAAWAVVLVGALMSVAFFVLSAACPGCDAVVMLPFHLSMIVLFCSFVGIFVFFLINDYAAGLKIHIFERSGELLTPTGARLRGKAIAAFTAVGVIPVALAILEVFAFSDARALQGMTTAEGFMFDFVLIVVMAGTSFFFIQRSMARPVELLHQAIKRLGSGQMDAKTPVITNDEIGGLAAGFNDMLEQIRERDFIKETFGRYVPEQVAEAILLNRGEFEPQNKLATILYTDIEGFTSICERLSPADIVELLNEYFNLVIGVIDRHGGIVNQFQGDALLVTYNVPVENQEHALAAVRTALEIQERLAAHDFKAAGKMNTRIGVNTGHVFAGSVGAGDRLNYTVHGDAVNIAARLEQLNKQFGTIVLISEETKSLAEKLAGETGEFEFRAMGAMPIRGKTEEISVYSAKRSP